MLITQYAKAITALCVAIVVLSGCSGGSISSVQVPTVIQTSPTASTNYNLQVIPSGGGSEKIIVYTENIDQDNRGGSVNTTQKIQRTRTIRYTLELGSGISVTANGEASIPAFGDISVGTEVSAHYGVSYGTEESISKEVEIGAAKGTFIKHTVSHVEYWETGKILITAQSQKIEIPYRFRRDFGLDLKSEDVTASVSTTANAPSTTPITPFYHEDFEGNVGHEWSTTKTEQSPSGRFFLGSFVDDNIFLKLQNLPSHKEMVVSFDLYIIGTWDGNGILDKYGPDIWGFNAGTFEYTTTFANNDPSNQEVQQSYPDVYDSQGVTGKHISRTDSVEIGMLGYTTNSSDPFKDTVYHLSFTVPHSDTTFSAKFLGNLSAPGSNAGVYDEKWGLDNVEIVLK